MSDPPLGQLTQACAPTTAELIYRYGFAPTVEEVAAEVESEDEGEEEGEKAEEATSGGGVAGCAKEGKPLKEDAVSIPLAGLVAACGSRLSPSMGQRRGGLLCVAGALDACPWDGLDGEVTAEVQRGGEGVGRLLGACYALLAETAPWAAAEAAVAAAAPSALKKVAGESPSSDDDGEEEEGEEADEEGDDEHEEGEDEGDEDDDDLAAAALVSALCGADGRKVAKLQKVAREHGGEEGDPWPALLQAAKLSSAVVGQVAAAAAAAVEGRRATLLAGGKSLPRTAPKEVELAAAWRAALSLRAVEETLLEQASEAIERWRASGGGQADSACGVCD